jgi:hypothetical protein
MNAGPFHRRRLQKVGSLLSLMGIGLLVDSAVRLHPLHWARGLDPFLLVDKPLESFEWYLGMSSVLVGVWLLRQSKAMSNDE